MKLLSAPGKPYIGVMMNSSGPSLKMLESLRLLERSEHLGLVTSNLDRITDANDTYLRMVGYSRAEMEAGLIDWRAMTPPQYLPLDEQRIMQLREFGASVPFEKEYVLRNGTRLPVLIGGVRLRLEPLEWLCFVVDLTSQKHAVEAERQARELQARTDVVSLLAHQINNPLEILANTLYLALSRAGLNPELTELLEQSVGAVARISASMKAMTATLSSSP